MLRVEEFREDQIKVSNFLGAVNVSKAIATQTASIVQITCALVVFMIAVPWTLLNDTIRAGETFRTHALAVNITLVRVLTGIQETAVDVEDGIEPLSMHTLFIKDC